MTLYLSRLQIRRDPSVQALSGLLDPAERGPGMEAHHRLVWSAFAGDPAAERDFLWRYEGKGHFLVLSHRPPEPTPFFEPPQTKEFAPDLTVGDRLAFALRANATRTRKSGRLTAGGAQHKQHIDLVMDALPPAGEGRADARMDVAREVGRSWLSGQGTQSGFRPELVEIEDYSVHRLARSRPGRQVTFGVLDVTGVLEVTDPAAFVAALARGFGRAKAFGCGLMLIRRA